MRCCIILELCCSKHVINVKVCNVFLWLNPWNKWCYIMSGKMIWIVLRWTCYTYIIYICAFVYLYLFRSVIIHFLCVVCIWILWWFQTLCSWEQMTRWMTLNNLVLEDVETQCYDRIWHWNMDFCFNYMIFWICYFTLFYFAA